MNPCETRIAIIGAGNWGTALAVVAGRAGCNVILWSRNQQVVNSINSSHVNCSYLKGFEISRNVGATTEIEDAVENANVIILAAPSHALRPVLFQLTPFLNKEDVVLVSATKGIEVETGKRVSQVVQEVIGDGVPVRFACLSGPSFSREVVEGNPTAIVAAAKNQADCRVVQNLLSYQNLRIYTNSDLVGVELGGSVKNVMAIAAGMVAGLGFGSNSIAALITRGLAEMTRLALAHGAKIETMIGLAGLGDLVLTCTGALSRNRFVGQELGKGRKLSDIMAEMHEVAEGVKTSRAVKKLADQSGIEMPITAEVHAVLYENKSPHEAADDLMHRPLRDEC